MKYVLDIIYVVAIIIYLPKVVYRRLFHGRYTEGGGERLGFVNRRSDKDKCVWIHSVSVGEVNATRTLVEELAVVLPDAEIVMSSTTDTGYARAKAMYGDKMEVFYYPLDFSWAVKRAFDRLKPDICILVELEVWPNFTREAQERGIPVVVFNGRLSDKSFPRYMKIRPITERMFSKVSKFLVQTRQYKNRFAALGVEEAKVIVTGSVKYDTAEVSESIEGSERVAAELGIDSGQRLFVVGGSGPGEEQIILDLFGSLKRDFVDLRLVIVPRKPERFNEVAAMIEKNGFDLIRYGSVKGGDQMREVSPQTVILVDTMGDLRKFYDLAEVVFVGRSLCPMGGSDMMESTALGKFTVFGRYTFNFEQTVEALLAGKGAVEVSDGADLEAVLRKALSDNEYKKMISENGRKVILENQGATAKSVREITELLSKRDKLIQGEKYENKR
jgi:3-deoxy-D-manno-octulosonic-acid transferase